MIAIKTKSKLKIIPLGGLGEIGMNCTVLEYEDEILVIDCGLLFSDLEHFGIEFVIPDFTYLKERKDKIKGFIITHGHEDHIGALPFAFKAGISASVYASEFTSLLIRERMSEHILDEKIVPKVFRQGDILEFKHFKVKPVAVNHSIVDSVALFIDTPVGKIVHTGDFKLDSTPFYGKPMDQSLFSAIGDEGVLLLMSDSTNIERQSETLSENVILQKFEQLFASSLGLTVVAMFSSNVGRMGQVFKLASRLGKRVAVTGRSMEQNLRLGMEAGYLKDAPAVLIGLDDLENYPRKDVIVLSAGSQAEFGSALIRASLGEHKQIELKMGDLVVMSSRYIPGNEKAIGRMVNNLFRQGAEVLYESVRDIHVSGHASRPELKRMLELVRPKFFIPVHGEYRHLVHHAALARETGVEPSNVLIAVNCDVIELTQNSCEKVSHLEENRVLIEGREGNDISKLVLKERRQMGERGVVFALLVRNSKTGKVVSGPEIITKGLVQEDKEGWFIDEATRLVKRVIAKFEQEKKRMDSPPETDLQEAVRLELRRFFNQNLGKKPVVLSIVMDL